MAFIKIHKFHAQNIAVKPVNLGEYTQASQKYAISQLLKNPWDLWSLFSMLFNMAHGFDKIRQGLFLIGQHVFKKRLDIFLQMSNKSFIVG